MPPHSTEAERSVLGAILLQNESIHRVIELGLEARDFYHQAHVKTFESLIALSQKGEALDLITLSSALRDRGHFEDVGGSEALTSLVQDPFAIANVGLYAKIIREKAILRRMIETCSEIIQQAFDPLDDVELFLDQAEKKIFEVSDTKASKSFSAMREILMENMVRIEDAAARDSAVTGTPSGFTDLDRLTSGFHPGQLIVVGGRPAMGKTSLVLSAAQNIGLSEDPTSKQKRVVAVFSLEMSKDELGLRLLSSMSRIDSKRLRVGRLTDRDWPRLGQAADELSKSKLYIDDSGDLTVLDMRARCRRLQNMEKRLDLVVVDYLQLMRGARSGRGESSREREISEISRNLKALSKELHVPIIALSQLSRALESRPDKRPMLSDLRESGAIEQDADIVAFVYRDEVYDKETEDKGIAELIIAKHRAGETDTIRLKWMGEYTLFANLAHDVPGTPIASPRAGSHGDVSL